MAANFIYRMVYNLKPYPAYKDSGVPWLGEVPEHWDVRRVKRIAQLNPSKSEVPLALREGRAVFLPMERVDSDGRFDASEVQPISDLWNGFTYFRRGDIIIAKITPCFENGKGACLENLPTAFGFGSTEFHVIRPSKAIVSAYLYRVTTISEFRQFGADEMTGAAGQQRVPVGFIANFPTPIPPLPEQTAIVRFLDYMDRRIRRSICAKQKLIKLLEEYRQVLIHQAVTGQIDVRTGQPYPAYKPSGVEWLGEVPAHWEILPLKWLAKCYRNGATPPTTKDFYYIGGTIPWYGPSSFDSGEIVSTPVRFISNTAIEDGVARLIHGPALLVVVIGATAGRMTLMEQDGTTNQQITAFELPYDWKTCLFLLRQLRFSESWLRETASTATIPILNTNIVTHLPCLMPPPKERCAIVEYLDAQATKINAAIAAARREIELLREYRERLIADVVTGKVDVREVAARLPEEPSEEDAPWTDEEERVQSETLNGEDDHATLREEDE